MLRQFQQTWLAMPENVLAARAFGEPVLRAITRDSGLGEFRGTQPAIGARRN